MTFSPHHPPGRRALALLAGLATSFAFSKPGVAADPGKPPVVATPAVKQAKPANLESVELFDVFRGKHVPEGQKSLAYAFTYRAADKTLTDVEVNAAHEKIVTAFKTQLSATFRE